LQKTEVSYSLWRRVYKWAVSNQYCFDFSPSGYVFDKDGDMGSMDLGGKHDASEPATDMTWYDAVAWCNALSELEGKMPCYYTDEAKTKVLRNIKERVNPAKYDMESTVYVKWDANGYRLPTSGEWAKAAIGKNEKMTREEKDGWIAVNADKTTHQVGKKSANDNGLHDMFGNVWEYCWDVPGDNFNPANQTIHTVLGGDFKYPADPSVNPLLKFGEMPFAGNYNIGFRVISADAGFTAEQLPASVKLPEKAGVVMDAVIPQWTIGRNSRVLPEGNQKITIPDGIEMVQIPAGGFIRTDDADVKLTEFKINKSEITFDSWRQVYQWAVMHDYIFDADGDMGSMDYQTDARGHDGNEPVTDITWKDAALWCNAFSEMTGKTPCYYIDAEKKQVYRRANQWRIAMYLGQMGYAVGKEEEKFLPIYCRWNADGYRLPTDAEWEYVYRDGIREQYPPIQFSGGKSYGDFGWTGADSGGTTHAVKTKKPNNYGVYDMEGNVSEWCWDWQGYDYYRCKDPKGNDKSGLFGKLIHGSNYGGEPVPFWRFFQDDPSAPRPIYGFRIVQCQADAHPADDKFVPDVVLKIDEKDYSLLQGQVWRGNVLRTGVLDVKGVPVYKGVKWKFKTDGKVRSSPVVVNGVVYIGSSDKNIYAIDAKTGEKKWQYATGDEVLSSAAIVDGVVYIGSNDGYLYALNADKGTLIWRFSRKKGPVKSSPAVAYGTVFAGFGTYGGGSLSGVDMKTGKENWRYRFQAGPSTATSPAIYGTGIYCPSPSIYSYAADIATEQTLWTTVLVASHVPPALTEDTIYILGSDMMALERVSGKFKWRVKIPGTREALMEFHDSAPIVNKDTVYFGANNKTYNAVNAKTGEKIWSVDFGGQVQSSGIFANGIIYVGSTDKYLYALDAKTGTTVWKYQMGDWVNSSPWATDDCIIVGCDDGNVYAIE
jgi:outer membrane protein assembly factor BamB/formylglycine-generating enzyme required for sulfatase activity